MTWGGELGLLDTWTAALEGSRRDRIVHLTRHVLGPDAHRRPWDVATAALLELAAGAGDVPLEAVVACPACASPVEVVVPVAALLDVAPAGAGTADGPATAPTVADVARAAALDPPAARRHLAAACGVGQLAPAEQRQALATLDQARPLLAPAVAFGCPSCGVAAETEVDVVDLAWTALAERALATLDDVVALAGAFGWREADVLAVPASRRALYRRAVEEAGGRG